MAALSATVSSRFLQKQRGSPNHGDATLAQPSSCMDENANLGAIFVSHSDLKCLMQLHASWLNDGDWSLLPTQQPQHYQVFGQCMHLKAVSSSVLSQLI
jgi:hypothetical protein